MIVLINVTVVGELAVHKGGAVQVVACLGDAFAVPAKAGEFNLAPLRKVCRIWSGEGRIRWVSGRFEVSPSSFSA
jgi:hypothetical protein